MTKVLSIVETAYRATLEEQDDTILWLNHSLKNNGLDITILLRSNAVNYAVGGQETSGLTFGTATLAHPPRIDEDIHAMLDKGIPVYFIREDVEERGIAEANLIDGVKGISRKEIPTLLGGFDHIWHW